MDIRKTAIKGIKWTTFATVGRSIFQILQISILTRFIPSEAFGLVAMALFVVHFSNIFVDMGMTSAILYRQNATKDEYSSIFWFNILISMFLYCLMLLSTPFISRFYNEQNLVVLIPILGINLLLLALGRQHRTIMQKHLQFKAIALIELFSVLIGLITAIVLAINSFGLYSLVYSTLVASFISNVLFLTQNLRINPISLHFKLNETKPFLKVGGFSMGSTLLDFFSHEIDILIIGKMLGAQSLGIYSLAKQIVLKLFSVINPIVITVLNPLLSSLQKEKFRLKIHFLKVIKLLAYVNFPVYVILIVSSREILHVMYGPVYAKSYMVLSFLAFAYCLIALSNPVGSLQIATGRTDIGFKWTILRVLITPAIIILGAMFNIEVVAAFYALLSLLLVIPLWFIQLRPMANIQLNEYLDQFYKPFLFFFIVMLTVFFLGFNIDIELSATSILSAVLKALFTMLAFSLYILIFDKKSAFESYNLLLSTIKL